ncbi:MAG: PEP-CTERM sorting domain-containing protein [Opitutaceae bacterium]|jgi:hypothetical protein
MKPIRNLVLATALVLVAASSRSLAAGTVTGLYEFGANASSPSFASTDADAGSTAGSLALSASLTTAGSGISTTSGNPIPQLFLKGVNNSTEALAISGAKYITFTITPVAGTLSFHSLSFDYNRDTTTTAKFYGLYVSTVGFTAGSSIDTNSTAFSSVTTFTNYSVVLSGIPSLQAVSGPVVFRLYFWGGTDANAIIRLDNISLTTAAIPEPSTYALVASAGLFLLVLGRRQRRSATLRPGA